MILSIKVLYGSFTMKAGGVQLAAAGSGTPYGNTRTVLLLTGRGGRTLQTAVPLVSGQSLHIRNHKINLINTYPDIIKRT
jgi:hypothetical protein